MQLYNLLHQSHTADFLGRKKANIFDMMLVFDYEIFEALTRDCIIIYDRDKIHFKIRWCKKYQIKIVGQTFSGKMLLLFILGTGRFNGQNIVTQNMQIKVSSFQVYYDW